MTERVFMAYNRRDADLAQRIAAELEKAGLSALDPEVRISAGESWRSAVRGSLEQSIALVVVVGSPHDAGSGWVTYEVGMAEATDKPVIVMSPNTHPTSDLPPELQQSRIRTFDPGQPENAARAVARDILAAA